MTTHKIKGNAGDGLVPVLCCGKLPASLPSTDRVTWLPELVTCGTDRTETQSLAAEFFHWKAVRTPSVALGIMERMLAELRRLQEQVDAQTGGGSPPLKPAAPADPDERINP